MILHDYQDKTLSKVQLLFVIAGPTRNLMGLQYLMRLRVKPAMTMFWLFH